MCKDLYNISIETISRHYLNTSAVLDFQQLKAQIKESDVYKNITGYYYAVMIAAIADFKKYINTNSYIKNKSKHTLEAKNLEDFRPPRPKEHYYPIMLLKVTFENGVVILPQTQKTEEMVIEVPDNYQEKSISKLTIRPLFGFNTWQMIIDYPVESIKHSDLSVDSMLAIDLGISNFATCAISNGSCFIIDGRHLMSTLQGYCKYKAALTSSNSGRHNTKRLISLHKKTHNRVDDYVRKSVRYIIKYCLDHGVGKIVLGWGIHFQTFNLGNNNQIYSLFPFAALKDLLTFKCKQHGIGIETIDECYTSQASFLDLDEIPQHVTRVKQDFSGKRIYRGMYVSANGIKLNADVNGAYNILRKAAGNAVIKDLGGRGIATPKRINPLKA